VLDFGQRAGSRRNGGDSGERRNQTVARQAGAASGLRKERFERNAQLRDVRLYRRMDLPHRFAGQSGVSGGIIAVLPGQFGIGIFSPLLDDHGNSCRGIQVCEELSARFKLHMFGARAAAGVGLRRNYQATTVRSIRQRVSVEPAILDRKGDAICVYELQGNLFFGALEQVFRKLTTELATLTYLVLDVKRVLEIDQCAITLIVQLNGWLASQGKMLIFAHLAPRFADRLKRHPDYVWTDKSFFAIPTPLWSGAKIAC
jgi:hypothetical protein